MERLFDQEKEGWGEGAGLLDTPLQRVVEIFILVFDCFVEGCNHAEEVGGEGGAIKRRASMIQGCEVLGNALGMSKSRPNLTFHWLILILVDFRTPQELVLSHAMPLALQE